MGAITAPSNFWFSAAGDAIHVVPSTPRVASHRSRLLHAAGCPAEHALEWNVVRYSSSAPLAARVPVTDFRPLGSTDTLAALRNARLALNLGNPGAREYEPAPSDANLTSAPEEPVEK